MHRSHGPRRCPGPALALAVILLAGVPGCSRAPTSPVFVEETTVFATLYVNELLTQTNAVTLRRTRPVDQPYSLADAAVRGAIVLLQAEGAAAPDTLTMSQPGQYSNPSVLIRPRTTYHLTVHDGAHTLTASTTTPAPFSVSAAPRPAPGTMVHSEIATRWPIVLDGSDPEQIMLMDTYCLEPLENAHYVNPIGDRDTPKDDKEYGGAQTPPRNVFLYFRLGDLPRDPSGYRLAFYGDMMQFYGRYKLGLFAIDANYYNFLYRDQPETHGGVNGGIGVFGSAARVTWVVETSR